MNGTEPAAETTPVTQAITATGAASAVTTPASDAGSSSSGQENRSGPTGDANRTGTSSTTAEEVAGDFHATDFGVHKSLRYHAKRRAFLDRLHRAAMAIIAVTGSAAFFTIFSDASNVGKVATLFAAAASAFDLTLSLPERARDHEKLYERFSDLAVRIARFDPNRLSPTVVRELVAKRLIIEADEPTAISALNVLCHNEEAEARGYQGEHLYHVGWFQRFVIQLGTLPWFKIKPREKSTATLVTP